MRQLPFQESSSKRHLVRSIRNLQRESQNLNLMAIPYTQRYSFMRNKGISSAVYTLSFVTHSVKKLATLKRDLSSDELEELRALEQELKNISDNVLLLTEKSELMERFRKLTKN